MGHLKQEDSNIILYSVLSRVLSNKLPLQMSTQNCIRLTLSTVKLVKN